MNVPALSSSCSHRLTSIHNSLWHHWSGELPCPYLDVFSQTSGLMKIWPPHTIRYLILVNVFRLFVGLFFWLMVSMIVSWWTQLASIYPKAVIASHISIGQWESPNIWEFWNWTWAQPIAFEGRRHVQSSVEASVCIHWAVGTRGLSFKEQCVGIVDACMLSPTAQPWMAPGFHTKTWCHDAGWGLYWACAVRREARLDLWSRAPTGL